MVGLVERGAKQIIHRSVGHDKCFRSIALGIEHLGQQCACLGDDEAPWLQQQFTIKAGESGADVLRISEHRSYRVEDLKVAARFAHGAGSS